MLISKASDIGQLILERLRMKGNFAAGQRTQPASPPASYGDFARGQRTQPQVPRAPDYASGQRAQSEPYSPGDFATGQRTPPGTPHAA